MPKSALDRYGRDTLGWPDNSQFVMPAREMDQLLTKAGGDVAAVEKALGIPPGQWADQALARIDVPKPRDLNLRMPSGNEMGANQHWLPGGRLPTGYREAVINQIPKAAYVERGVMAGKGDVGRASSKLEQSGLNKLAAPRTPGLASTSTTSELLQMGGIPGRDGVVLTQPHVAFKDLWALSEQSGMEFVLTRESGAFVLRSGSPTSAPIPAGVRPIAHTHPLDEHGLNSLLPSKADINVLNRYWAMNPTVQRPVSQIITGLNQTTPFRATGLDPWGSK